MEKKSFEKPTAVAVMAAITVGVVVLEFRTQIIFLAFKTPGHEDVKH